MHRKSSFITGVQEECTIQQGACKSTERPVPNLIQYLANMTGIAVRKEIQGLLQTVVPSCPGVNPSEWTPPASEDRTAGSLVAFEPGLRENKGASEEDQRNSKAATE
ncbi:uncharacterized protein PAE49_022387 [Odontesthes bonariensis]